MNLGQDIHNIFYGTINFFCVILFLKYIGSDGYAVWDRDLDGNNKYNGYNLTVES